ncbi:unnamed protein product, partial [Adineta ricciae]
PINILDDDNERPARGDQGHIGTSPSMPNAEVISDTKRKSFNGKLFPNDNTSTSKM